MHILYCINFYRTCDCFPEKDRQSLEVVTGWGQYRILLGYYSALLFFASTILLPSSCVESGGTMTKYYSIVVRCMQKPVITSGSQPLIFRCLSRYEMSYSSSVLFFFERRCCLYIGAVKK